VISTITRYAKITPTSNRIMPKYVSLAFVAVVSMVNVLTFHMFDLKRLAEENNSVAIISVKRKQPLADARIHDSDCNLLPESDAPSPVILMALGRSGSSITWDAMSQLTGQRNTAYEVTGGNTNNSKAFFKDLETNPYVGHDWAIKRLCHIQQNRPDILSDAGIAGFQWKPYMSSFDHEYAIEGLREIAAHRNPSIRVVHLTRNALDKRISNIRHTNSKKSSKAITAHCPMGDEECIKNHSQFVTSIVFPTGQELLHWLRHTVDDDNTIRKRLGDLGVHHVEVSYEKLYNSNDAEEWMRIFRFLEKGPSEGLAMGDVRASFSMASTHTKSRNETIANFEDVRETLVGTPFEHLLAD